MILIQQFCKFFLSIGLVLLLGNFTAFISEGSLVTSLLNQPISLAHTQIATIHSVEAMTKNIEGQAQETMGNLTGDKKNQIMGKIKQVQSKVMNAQENIKDANTNFQQKSKAVTNNIAAQTEKEMDNSIVNPNYLPNGKTEDTKTQSRTPANKMKDEIRNTFN
jgi:uncharacterized protein YjbJ (UPF0337 family)